MKSVKIYHPIHYKDTSHPKHGILPIPGQSLPDRLKKGWLVWKEKKV